MKINLSYKIRNFYRHFFPYWEWVDNKIPFHPSAIPNCEICNGVGIVKKKYCPNCIDVGIAKHLELGGEN